MLNRVAPLVRFIRKAWLESGLDAIRWTVATEDNISDIASEDFFFNLLEI